MKNKLIIIGIIVAAAIAILYFLNIGGLGGPKTLTRDEAAKIIFGSLKNSPDEESVRYDGYYKGYSTTFVNSIYGSSLHDKTDELQKAGLIEDVKHPNGDPRYTIFTFTDKAKPYLRPDASVAGDEDIILGLPSSVQITGLTQPAADKSGHNVITAAYIVKFQLTPFGQILSGSDSRSGSDDLILYDDGWRLAR